MSNTRSRAGRIAELMPPVQDATDIRNLFWRNNLSALCSHGAACREPKDVAIVQQLVGAAQHDREMPPNTTERKRCRLSLRFPARPTAETTRKARENLTCLGGLRQCCSARFDARMTPSNDTLERRAEAGALWQDVDIWLHARGGPPSMSDLEIIDRCRAHSGFAAAHSSALIRRGVWLVDTYARPKRIHAMEPNADRDDSGVSL